MDDSHETDTDAEGTEDEPDCTKTAQHLPSSNRQMRNQAEKMRRDKLNTYISELATQVPMVAQSPKRTDKISILRLTAAYILMNRTLHAVSEERMCIPSFLESINFSDAILEDMDGFLLIVTAAGKIVLVTDTVQKLLGHSQNDLFGQSLYNITCPEDHAELTKNLAPDPDPSAPDCTSVSQPVIPDDSSSDDTNSSSNQSLPSPQPLLPVVIQPPPIMERQRRSFHLRLSQRAVSRSEVAQYEMFHVLGHLRVPQRTRQDPSSSTSTSRNDAVLVAVVKLFKETRVAELSLLEATRDEYITRHLIDGRFIYCDHRISVVSGYFPEEVSGLSAFKFMHKEDFLYTMIALRQMYDRYGQGEGYGSSVYRLRCKNGQFIFMRTHGYVEYSKTTHQVESFICVNSFISDEEGLAGLKEMRSRYSASVISSGRAALVDSATANGMFPSPSSSDIPASPEDSNKAEEGSADPLDVAISQLISNLPQAAAEDTNDITSPLPDIQYVKVVHFSKSMPPPHLQAAKAGVYAPTPRYEKRMPGLDSPESVPPISPAPSTPDSVSTASSGSQDRPTVITERPSVFSVNPMARPSAKSVCVPARTESVCVKSSGATTTVLKRAGSSSDCDRISPAPKRLHASYRNRKREQASPSSQVETEQSVWPKMSPEQQHRVIMSRSISPPETGQSYSTRCSSSPQGSILLRSISPSETGNSYSTRCPSSPQENVLLRSISPSETGKSYSTRHSSSPQESVLLRSISPSGIGQSYSTRHSSSPQGSVLLRSISPSETGQSYSTRHSSSPQGSVLLRSISPSGIGPSYTTRHSSSPQESVLLRTQESVLLRSISPSGIGPSYTTRHPSSPQGSVLLRSISPSETGKSYSTIYPGSPQGSVMLKVNQTIVHSPAPSSPLTYPDFSGGSHPLSPFHMMGGPDLLGYQSTAVLSPHTDSNSFSSLGMVDTDSTAPTDLIDMLAVNTDALRSGFILDVSDADHIYGDSSEPLDHEVCPPESLDQVTGSFSSMEEQFKGHTKLKTHEQDSQFTTMVQHVPLGSQVFGANITQLRVGHRKQQIIHSIQQDRHHCKDKLKVCSVKQDVGV